MGPSGSEFGASEHAHVPHRQPNLHASRNVVVSGCKLEGFEVSGAEGRGAWIGGAHPLV